MTSIAATRYSNSWTLQQWHISSVSVQLQYSGCSKLGNGKMDENGTIALLLWSWASLRLLLWSQASPPGSQTSPEMATQQWLICHGVTLNSLLMLSCWLENSLSKRVQDLAWNPFESQKKVQETSRTRWVDYKVERPCFLSKPIFTSVTILNLEVSQNDFLDYWLICCKVKLRCCTIIPTKRRRLLDSETGAERFPPACHLKWISTDHADNNKGMMQNI